MPQIDFDVIVELTNNLPSLPQVTWQALQIIDDPGYSVTRLASVIGLDQTLTARLLQWSNSAFYGVRYKVSTPEQAIMTIGAAGIKDLLLTVSVGEMLKRQMPGYGLKRGDLWHHSIAAAAGSKWLAARCTYVSPSQVFIAGLLHDIGKLVMDELLRRDETWRAEWLKLQDQGRSFMELEHWLTGMDHAQLGGRIAEQWGLPAVLVEAITYHHEPHRATIEPDVTRWVHLADVAALMLGIGLGYDGLGYEMNEGALRESDFSAISLEELLEVEITAVTDAEIMFDKV